MSATGSPSTTRKLACLPGAMSPMRSVGAQELRRLEGHGGGDAGLDPGGEFALDRWSVDDRRVARVRTGDQRHAGLPGGEEVSGGVGMEFLSHGGSRARPSPLGRAPPPRASDRRRGSCRASPRGLCRMITGRCAALTGHHAKNLNQALLARLLLELAEISYLRCVIFSCGCEN